MQSAKKNPEEFNSREEERPRAPQLEVLRRFNDIEGHYMLAREQAWLAARRRLEVAEMGHSEAVADLQKYLQEKLGQAYQQGVDAWEAGRSVDSWNHYLDLNRQYAAATRKSYEEACARFEESLRALNKER